MRSKRLKKQGAAAPVVNRPSGEGVDIRALLFPSLTKEQLEAEAAFAEYIYQEYGQPDAETRRKFHERMQTATPAERTAYEEVVASLFRMEEEENPMRTVQIGDTVYWRDPDDGECSGYYAITSIVNDEELGESIYTLEDGTEVLTFELDFDCQEFTPGTLRPKDDREKSIPYEQVKAEQDRELEAWVAEAKRKLRDK
jgi:hypothetical protein